MPENPISYYSQGFKDSIADFENKQAKEQERLKEMAKSIMPASEVKMFGSHHAALTDFAKELNNNINKYASSTQGQAEFYQLLNQYNQMKADSEAFFTNNYGSPDDAMTASTFIGAFKSNASGVNPFEEQGYKDENDMSHYENILNQYDKNAYRPGSLRIENGKVVVNHAELGEVQFSDMFTQDPIFARNLTEFAAPSGYEVYDSVQGSFRKAHTDENAVRNYVQKNLASDESSMRRAIRHYLNENPSEIKPEVAYTDETIREEAIKLYQDEAVQAWNDRRPQAKTTTTSSTSKPTAKQNELMSIVEASSLSSTSNRPFEESELSSIIDEFGVETNVPISIKGVPINNVVYDVVYLTLKPDGSMNVTVELEGTSETIENIQPGSQEYNIINKGLMDKSGKGIDFFNSEEFRNMKDIEVRYQDPNANNPWASFNVQ